MSDVVSVYTNRFQRICANRNEQWLVVIKGRMPPATTTVKSDGEKGRRISSRNARGKKKTTDTDTNTDKHNVETYTLKGILNANWASCARQRTMRASSGLVNTRDAPWWCAMNRSVRQITFRRSESKFYWKMEDGRGKREEGREMRVCVCACVCVRACVRACVCV